MREINFALLFTSIMILVSANAFAASNVNYEVEVGKTLRLDIKDIGVELMANEYSYSWDIKPSYIGDTTNYSEYLSFTFKSKNYAIVKGLKEGQLITIQYKGVYYYNNRRGEFEDVFYVRVVAPGTPSEGPATLEVLQTSLTMEVGDTKWIYAKQTRAIGGTHFYSENEDIATVTFGELASEGSYTTAAKITAKRVGNVNIVAINRNGLTAVCKLTVSAQPIFSISILTDITMKVGEAYTLTPTIVPSYAETSFTWTSDNIRVASVSSSGRVTANNAGTANIKVTTNNGKTATCKVTVTADLKTINVSDSEGLADIPAEANVEYERHFYKGWNSLCVPFALTKEMLDRQGEGIKIAIYKRVETVGQQKQLVLQCVDKIKAGQPCLFFSPKEFNCNFKLENESLVNKPDNSGPLKGSFTTVTIGAGYYKLASDGASISITTDKEAKSMPFRAYLDL